MVIAVLVPVACALLPPFINLYSGCRQQNAILKEMEICRRWEEWGTAEERETLRKAINRSIAQLHFSKRDRNIAILFDISGAFYIILGALELGAHREMALILIVEGLAMVGLGVSFFRAYRKKADRAGSGKSGVLESEPAPVNAELEEAMSCEYCRGEKPLIAIQDDLFGVGAIIEADELRAYGIYDGGYPNGDERVKIEVCPKCGAKLPVDGAHGPFALEDLVPDLARVDEDPAAS